MAFFDAGNYQVVPHTTVERRTNIFGTKEQRDVVEYRLTWACDDSGGESPPATYSGADLLDHAPEVKYGGANGLYVALYRSEGGWS